MELNRIKSFLGLCLLIVLLAACNGKKAASLSDFSNQLYTPEYASGFSIKGADGYESSIITVTNPWQGADSITTQLFIARGGESAPRRVHRSGTRRRCFAYRGNVIHSYSHA